MNKNKISYRPRTADPSTLTMDNLLTLANIITTSRLDHHCPPSLGVLTSVQITMLYLQENIRQQALASIFGTSQPTISRAINNVLNVLDVVLPPPPRPKDLKSPTAIRVRWHARAVLVVEKRQELCAAENTTKQGITCKYSPTRQARSFIFHHHYQDQPMTSQL